MTRTLTQDQRNSLFEAVKATDEESTIALHNYICRERKCDPDSEIFEMDFIDDLIPLDSYKSVVDVWWLFDNDFNPHDDYFWFDGYGRVCSGAAYVAVKETYPADIASHIADMWEENALDDVEWEISQTPIEAWLASLDDESSEDSTEDAD